MPQIPGLFLRGSIFYVRVVLPAHHPLRSRYPSGRLVLSLGAGTRRQAALRALCKRAEVLGETAGSSSRMPEALPDDAPLRGSPRPPCPSAKLRDVFDRWRQAKHRPADTVAACERALKLYEANTPNPDISALTRSDGDAFRAWLIAQSTTSKTAHDRFTWVKSLLKYAHQDLGMIGVSPWAGLEIETATTTRRRPWSDVELAKLFAHEIWTEGRLPVNAKAGGAAAYWVPLLALYTGARCGELCQLTVADIAADSDIPTLRITDDGHGQRLKSAAAERLVPIHSELLRLGFLDYVRAQPGPSIWPSLPLRKDKPGGYFSAYFTTLRQSLGLGSQVVFHSFRHTVRSKMAEIGVPESTIDRLLGHLAGGSVGARVYTHTSLPRMRIEVERLKYTHSASNLSRLSSLAGS